MGVELNKKSLEAGVTTGKILIKQGILKKLIQKPFP